MEGIGARLRAIRKAQNLRQEDLEEISGVPQNTISRIEIGKALEISTKTLVPLARALKVRTDVLLGLEDWSGQPEKPAPKKKRARKPVAVG
jgi:transcriptional regulator with XRE-family HTH domain